MDKPAVISITGPSATGKTELSVKLARKFDGEIVSADSRYIYKEIDIAAAKPSEKEKQGIKHYFIDVCDVTSVYTAGSYAKDATETIRNIVKSGKLPIVTGGTGLYTRALYGDFDIPKVPPDKNLRTELKKKSNEELFQMLQKLDPEAAQKIHPNNTVKVVRALEVSLITGKKMSEQQLQKTPDFDFLKIILDVKNRDFLYEKINLRTEKMFENGLEQEAKKLFEKYGKNDILMNTIGIKEFYDYFYGDRPFEEVVRLVKQDTRRYSKRQISWFSKEQGAMRFYIDEMNPEQIFEEISRATEKCIGQKTR